MELAIPLSRLGEPLFRQVYAGIRNSILSGTLTAHQRLPSTRDLAEQLGISRTVILAAYDQLMAEGFVTGKRGSGTYVAAKVDRKATAREPRAVAIRLSRFGKAAGAAMESVELPRRSAEPLRYDFLYGRSDLEVFPFEAWRRILARRARMAPARQFDYGSPLGNTELREAISNHLRRSRAVVCDPEQIIVVSGSQQALDLVARVLVEPGDSVAIENPHYNGTREALRAAGARLLPVPVDRDGLNPAKLPGAAKVVFVTPSHQFPTGAILPIDRRMALLEWARRSNAVIVENDYDGEFSYNGRPLESLQGLDRQGRVIYVGTFSRTVFSSLRIGYLIPPHALVPAFTAAKWISDLQSAALEQQTLAEFIAAGLYERHLRRLRRRNALRRKALLDAIATHLGDRVEITGDGSGAHVVLWPRKPASEQEIVAEAARRGVGIYGIAHCYLNRPARSAFMLGYARLNEREIEQGIRLLAEVL